MFKTIATAAAFAGVLLGATVALAGPPTVTVTNQTGQRILTMSFSPSTSPQWGPDVLGSQWLEAGESAEVNFAPDDPCVWDVQVGYEDNSTRDWRGINLCENPSITLN